MTSHKLLQGFVGTQAYMAPEVFTRNMHEGHGRAADIWFVNPELILDLNISVLLIYGWKNLVKKNRADYNSKKSLVQKLYRSFGTLIS